MMALIRLFIRIPPVLYFLIAGGLSYMDYDAWMKGEQNDLQGQIQSLESTLAAKKDEVKRAEDFKLRRDEKLAELQALRTKLEQTKGKLPRSSSVPDLLKSLADLAERAGLNFSRFRPEAPRKNQFLVETPVSVDFSGTYVQLMSFLDATANLERIVATEKLNLNPNAGGGATQKNANVTGTTFLRAGVQLLTYHLDEGFSTSASTAPGGQSK
jgi:Tfp pilus assembly protein PilO